MKETKDETFKADIASGVVLVDFAATWCGPCKMMAPLLEQVSNEKKDVTILKLDVDENPDAASEYSIRALPSMVLFKDGVELDRTIGAMSKSQIEKWIDDAVAGKSTPPPAKSE